MWSHFLHKIVVIYMMLCNRNKLWSGRFIPIPVWAAETHGEGCDAKWHGLYGSNPTIPLLDSKL